MNAYRNASGLDVTQDDIQGEVDIRHTLAACINNSLMWVNKDLKVQICVVCI